MKPARKAISTPRGEGTWGTTGGREQVGGQGPGGLQTIPPWVTGAPDLACKMRPRHAARVQRPYGQTPTATRPRLRGHDRARTRSHTRGFTQRRHPHVADAVPDWLEARNPGVLASGWSRLSALGPKAWGQEEEEQEKNILSSLCFRTLRCHYVLS